MHNIKSLNEFKASSIKEIKDAVRYQIALNDVAWSKQPLWDVVKGDEVAENEYVLIYNEVKADTARVLRMCGA